MTDFDKKPSSRWIWMFALILMFAVLFILFAKPLEMTQSIQPAKPVAQSTEWTTDPEGAAVPVNLPTTKLKAVPIDDMSEAREPEAE